MKHTAFYLALVLPAGIFLNSCKNETLENDLIRADLRVPGEISILDKKLGETVRFGNIACSITVNDEQIPSSEWQEPEVERDATGLTYRYEHPSAHVEVRYEVKPGWRFISRQIMINRKGREKFRVNRIQVYKADIENIVSERFPLTAGKYGISLRIDRLEPGSGYGCFVLVQNPYARYEGAGKSVEVTYDPEMDWDPADGPFRFHQTGSA